MREKTVEIENMFLSPYAKKSEDTLGRAREEEPCPMRTDFQRDRDRIIHCKSFRRLKNKTQVFFCPEGDNYRTRLTHTIDVTQIARSIARALSLNEDLTEAIALGHDLGHTPFGHSGERVLDKLSPYGFKHNEQSKRVVEFLENDGQGLNLTAADYVIHLDPWWNPAVEDQASDRAYRLGQQRPVTVYRLVARGTVEESILKLHRSKRALAADVLEGTDVPLSEAELMDLIRR